MPIVEHRSFIQPPDDARLWRYMEFAKFASLITTSSLWFCNARVLAKEDPFEGTLPKSATRIFTREDIEPGLYKRLGGPEATPERREQVVDSYVSTMNRLPEIFIQSREANFISCWHLASYETAAMWKIYGKHDGGIAITTNLARLRKAFEQTGENIYCGQIQYIDFETDSIDISNMFNPILRKRKSFETEHEVRLVYHHGQSAMPGADVPVGAAQKCSLIDLIDEIWISPTAPSYIADVVADICRLANFEARTRRSTLLDPPYNLQRPGPQN